MAMISPYGDPNAHGPINKTYCFQRYKSKVFLRNIPRPVSRNTAAQITQRQKFSDASAAYNLLTGSSKYFYKKRAAQKMMTSKNLYMSGNIKQYLPSILRPIPAKSIEDLVIFTPAGLYEDEILISVANSNDLHNTLGSDHEIQNSQLGKDGEVHGTLIYNPGKFYKGMFTNDLENYATFDHRPSTVAGAIGIWFVAEENSSAAHRHLWSIDTRSVGDPSSDHMSLKWDVSKFAALFRKGGSGYLTVNTSITSYTIGQKIFFLLVYDKNGIAGGSNQIRIYADDVLVGSSDVANRIPDWGILEPLFHLGLAALDPPNRYNVCFNTLDNLKIHYAPAMTQAIIDDINDNRENENWNLFRNYGNIYDSENIYNKEGEMDEPDLQKIIISTPSGHPCHIPFRYLMRVEWKDSENEVFNSVIRLPEIILGEGESIDLFLSKDWSVYRDKNFRRLACTNQL